MADNVPITAGAGTDIATDQVTGTGEHVQLTKLAQSADGSRATVQADADGLLVNLGSNNDVVVSDGGGSLTVDGIVAISGTVSVSDGAGSITVDDGGASLTVDGSVSVSGQVQVGDGTNAVSVTTAGADANSNTANALRTQARLMGYNGTTWDRLRSTIANGLAVDVTRVSGTVTISGTTAATQSGTWTVQPGNTANTTPWLTAPASRTTGGLTTYHLVSAASTNATNVKASAGTLYGWYIYNSNASARKVAFHNTAGTPTAGASVLFSLVLPPTSGANVFMPIGIAFSTGIAITTVTGIADSDAAAVALNDLTINLWYA